MNYELFENVNNISHQIFIISIIALLLLYEVLRDYIHFCKILYFKNLLIIYLYVL